MAIKRVIRIATFKERFKNRRGKKVPVNKDLAGKYIKNETKQEAIVLIDEIFETAKYGGESPAAHPHGWLDDNGKNKWKRLTSYLEEKNKTIWEATLQIATSANGEKHLYDIFPTKKVEQSGESDTSTTDVNISQPETEVNSEFSQLSRKVDRLGDLEVLERAAKGMELGELDAEQKAALEEFGFAAGASPCPAEWETDFRIHIM